LLIDIYYMRKTCFFFLFTIIQLHLVSQTMQVFTNQSITPGGIMDSVYDRFGKKYSIRDLQVDLKINADQGILSSTSTSCIAGMFAVYYASGSGMESPTNPLHITRRQTVCEVLSNISGLLGYSSSYPNSALVRILVDDVGLYTAPVTPSASGVLGLATAYYAVPWNPASSNPGITENMIQKTIKSQTDGWTNVVSPVAPIASNGLFHGMMAFNFSNPLISWNSGYTGIASSTQFDLYSVILHEITHALGFASLIDVNGISKFGPANNYYSLYDKFLNCFAFNTLQPLLGLGNSCTGQYDLIFGVGNYFLAPNCTGSYTTDLTNCATAIKYNSVLVPNTQVYTPDCFEPSSSLSHFEDMCYPANTASNNNLYFAMSNANVPGVNKRFLQPEEKNVLCDLGYTVTNTYTSNAASASYTYSGGTCISPQVWGINDGFNNNAYSYTSTGGPVTIPIIGATGVIMNDYQGSNPVTTISCVESVYNNGTAVVSGTNIVFTPNNSNGGVFLLRYIPENSFGASGNITYIYGFVYPSFCGTVSPCDLVQNGGFENNSGCGYMPQDTSTLASCWLVSSLSPDIFTRGCTSSIPPANLGTNTFSSIPVFDSFSGSPNNSIAGIGAYTALNELYGSESLSNYLGSPILNNQAYTLSFWAYQFAGTKYDPGYFDSNGFVLQSFNTASISAILSFATQSLLLQSSSAGSTYPYPPLDIIKSVTLANSFNTWKHYSLTFTTTAINGGNWLYVGMDNNLTMANIISAVGSQSVNGHLFYTLLDDISLRPSTQAPQLSLPSQICSGQSLLDLGQYVNIPAGNFSGIGVTSSLVSTPNGTVIQYNFNASQAMVNGVYVITFTFTDNINCTQTAIQQLKIGNVYSGLNISYASTTNCVNGGTLSVVSPPGTYSYTWQPGNYVGASYLVTPSINTNYTVVGTNGSSCSVTGSINVKPNKAYALLSLNGACAGTTMQIIAAGNYTSILWQPGNYTTSAINVLPFGPTTYSAFITNSLGCVSTETVLVSLGLPPAINISVSSSSICSGQTITLIANGASNYVWSNNVTSAINIVNPTSTTVYTVTGTAMNNCAGTATAQVKVFTPNISLSGSNVICAGETVTLSAQSGANIYTWLPVNLYSPVIPVSPSVTTNYTVSATIYPGGMPCTGKNTIQITVDPCTGETDLHARTHRFILYPNPNDGTFYIESEYGNDLQVEIYNEYGQFLKSCIINEANDHRIAVEFLPAGFYFIRSGNYRAKLIISK